jgi:hypothetical protein
MSHSCFCRSSCGRFGRLRGRCFGRKWRARRRYENHTPEKRRRDVSHRNRWCGTVSAAQCSCWRSHGRSAQRRFLRTLRSDGHAGPRTERHPLNAKAHGRNARTNAGNCCSESDRYARYHAAVRIDNRARNPRHACSQLTYFAAEPDGNATGRTRSFWRLTHRCSSQVDSSVEC